MYSTVVTDPTHIHTHRNTFSNLLTIVKAWIHHADTMKKLQIIPVFSEPIWAWLEQPHSLQHLYSWPHSSGTTGIHTLLSLMRQSVRKTPTTHWLSTYLTHSDVTAILHPLLHVSMYTCSSHCWRTPSGSEVMYSASYSHWHNHSLSSPKHSLSVGTNIERNL